MDFNTSQRFANPSAMSQSIPKDVPVDRRQSELPAEWYCYLEAKLRFLFQAKCTSATLHPLSRRGNRRGPAHGVRGFLSERDARLLISVAGPEHPGSLVSVECRRRGAGLPERRAVPGAPSGVQPARATGAARLVAGDSVSQRPATPGLSDIGRNHQRIHVSTGSARLVLANNALGVMAVNCSSSTRRRLVGSNLRDRH